MTGATARNSQLPMPPRPMMLSCSVFILSILLHKDSRLRHSCPMCVLLAHASKYTVPQNRDGTQTGQLLRPRSIPMSISPAVEEAQQAAALAVLSLLCLLDGLSLLFGHLSPLLIGIDMLIGRPRSRRP